MSVQSGLSDRAITRDLQGERRISSLWLFSGWYDLCTLLRASRVSRIGRVEHHRARAQTIQLQASSHQSSAGPSSSASASGSYAQRSCERLWCTCHWRRQPCQRPATQKRQARGPKETNQSWRHRSTGCEEPLLQSRWGKRRRRVLFGTNSATWKSAQG